MADDIAEQLESQIRTLKARLDEAETTVKKLTLERNSAVAGQHIAAAAAAAGVMPAAIQDVVSRALRTGDWREDSTGRIVRFSADGFPDIDQNCDAITPGRIIQQIRVEAPFYWPDDMAPAQTGHPSAASSAVQLPLNLPSDLQGNPWKKEERNITRQAQIWQRDPELAQRLADEAGVPLASARHGR